MRADAGSLLPLVMEIVGDLLTCLFHLGALRTAATEK